MKTKTRLLTGSVGMIILSMFGFLLFTAFKATTENDKTKLVMEIRSYLDKNVKPVMKPQRVKLDQILSLQEKKELARLNSQLRQLILKRNAMDIGFITSREFSFNVVPAYTAKQKAGQKESRDEMRRIMSSAWFIFDNHEKEIEQLLNEKSSFFGTWERGISAIVTDYLDDKFLFIGKKQFIKRFENREIVKYYSPVAFLLWDPEQRFISDELIGK
ncbi:MAG: hypothetical protein Q8M08_08760 [Bacteroidales bacterium]|nr:hypothetical protein [Bacteroidales bacterium]